MQLPPLEVIASWPKANYINPEERGYGNIIINVVLFPLTCMAIAIRVYTRLRISKSFGIDDWLILAALVPSTAFMIISLLSETKFAWNRHIWDVPFDQVILGMKIIISTQILFTAGTMFVKCSMLTLIYRVVSKGTGHFPKVVLGAIVLVVVQSTLFTFMVIFQCRPISAYWTPSFLPQTNCINQSLHLLIAGIINTVTDLMTVLLPIPTVWKLQLPLQQQIIVMMLFGAGILVTAAGGLRTYYTYEATVQYDATWHVYQVWLTSSVELYVGIICASLPATKTFFSTFLPTLLGSSFLTPKAKNTSSSSSNHSKLSDPLSSTSSSSRRLSRFLHPTLPFKSPQTPHMELESRSSSRLSRLLHPLRTQTPDVERDVELGGMKSPPPLITAIRKETERENAQRRAATRETSLSSFRVGETESPPLDSENRQHFDEQVMRSESRGTEASGVSTASDNGMERGDGMESVDSLVIKNALEKVAQAGWRANGGF